VPTLVSIMVCRGRQANLPARISVDYRLRGFSDEAPPATGNRPVAARALQRLYQAFRWRVNTRIDMFRR
jgi:hypothetical protein